MKWEIVSEDAKMESVFQSVHTVWHVKTNDGYLYVSHQTSIPYSGSECMVFTSDESGRMGTSDPLAVSYERDADEAFRDVMEQMGGEL